jgi:hypothetical protein
MTVWRDENSEYRAPYDFKKSPTESEIKAWARPATEKEMAERLLLLVKAFPNVSTSDGEVYGATLINDVAATEPAIGDLEEACRYLRRTLKFLPTIAEVLDALYEAKQQRKAHFGHLEPKPRLVLIPKPSTPPTARIERRQTIPQDNPAMTEERDALPL